MIFELFDYLLESLHIAMFEYHDKKSTTSASDEEVHTPWPQ